LTVLSGQSGKKNPPLEKQIQPLSSFDYESIYLQEQPSVDMSVKKL
jgi:hypothetical protein